MARNGLPLSTRMLDYHVRKMDLEPQSSGMSTGGKFNKS